jgi:hypothetical protein
MKNQKRKNIITQERKTQKKANKTIDYHKRNEEINGEIRREHFESGGGCN